MTGNKLGMKMDFSNCHLSVELNPKLGLQGVHFVWGYGVNLQEEFCLPKLCFLCHGRRCFSTLQDLAIRVLQNCVPPHLNLKEMKRKNHQKSVWRRNYLDFYLVGDVAWFFQLLLQVFIFPLVVSWVWNSLDLCYKYGLLFWIMIIFGLSVVDLARNLRVWYPGVFPLSQPVH